MPCHPAQPTEPDTPGAQAWAAFFAAIREQAQRLDALEAEREQGRQQEAARLAQEEERAA